MPATTRREEFDLKLVGLEAEVEGLAYYVSDAVHRSVEALKTRDLAASRQVIEDDDYIDQKQAEIEARCINLIATQQPVARDLRSIIALLHIGVELERMGDYAEGIGKISASMGGDEHEATREPQ
ncbi:Phosphate-specific transport system accessory protein PhoU homolog [Geodia barretti]|uniref:Phosphate-specific transport system accessory protein PhoU homolog n=1 Tax=Geodia barretti TaxID=519541 RepID=A0AA35R6K3_GEOBA|nr:Phosphate-specific transport system accessory protein PhoU homolog [Geodia barretti]